MNNIMLDLETMGNKPGSAITAIGAVRFDENGVSHKFYQPVDVESSISAGMKIDGDTVKWWMKQSDDARSHINDPRMVTLVEALFTFSQWATNSEGNVQLWGNGASFDNVIIGDAYDLTSIERPWEFWNDRCYRTVKSLFPSVKLQRVGTHHNAVDDAESQALHLIKIAKTFWLTL